MDKTTLVTGGTGLIGYNIISALLKRKRKVMALVRSPEKGKELLPPAVELIQGDITDKDSLTGAMESCEVVFDDRPKGTVYERSKQKAFQVVLEGMVKTIQYLKKN